jgi:hypothetical protein
MIRARGQAMTIQIKEPATTNAWQALLFDQTDKY